MERRTLTVKRELLHELTSDELAGIAGAATRETAMSCLDYISCWAWQCLPTFDRECIE